MVNNDLKRIRKLYGERMIHLCRTLFPTLLATPGLLPNILESAIAPSHTVVIDIEDNNLQDKFKDFVYSYIKMKEALQDSNATPFELMKKAGYTLYECHTEEDIQSFRKYYKSGLETICTITRGKRLERCLVFFAVKDNVENIRRENFPHPSRDDEYGTSVISIQFSRGSFNNVAIMNRYNHAVDNPDCTLGNDLERICPGLTKSFERYYNLNIQRPVSDVDFLSTYMLYIKANNGKLYRYNCDYDDVYYCENNIIVDHGIVIDKYAKNKERYILMDYFVLDLKEKKISLYDRFIEDSFIDSINDLGPIENIKVTNEGEYRLVNIFCENNKSCQIKLDRSNRIIGYINNDIEEIKNKFLTLTCEIKYVEMKKVKRIHDDFLPYAYKMDDIVIPNVKVKGKNFLRPDINIFRYADFEEGIFEEGAPLYNNFSTITRERNGK